MSATSPQCNNKRQTFVNALWIYQQLVLKNKDEAARLASAC